MATRKSAGSSFPALYVATTDRQKHRGERSFWAVEELNTFVTKIQYISYERDGDPISALDAYAVGMGAYRGPSQRTRSGKHEKVDLLPLGTSERVF